jgi:F-type H+-transporting ATPase subunit b
LAAEGGHGSAAAWKDFMWRVLNLALFLGIVYKLAGQRIKEFFSGRKESIRNELQDLENRKGEAAKELQRVEDSIAGLNQERQAILDEAQKQGQAAREAILAKAHEEAEKIKEQARLKAEQETQMMLESLRAEMADRIIESAEKMLTEKLSKKEQEKLVDKYLTKVVLN